MRVNQAGRLEGLQEPIGASPGELRVWRKQNGLPVDGDPSKKPGGSRAKSKSPPPPAGGGGYARR